MKKEKKEFSEDIRRKNWSPDQWKNSEIVVCPRGHKRNILVAPECPICRETDRAVKEGRPIDASILEDSIDDVSPDVRKHDKHFMWCKNCQVYQRWGQRRLSLRLDSGYERYCKACNSLLK